MTRIQSLVLSIIILAAAVTDSRSQDINDLSVQIDALFAEWDNESTPGAALGIVQDGQLVYKKGYGMSNLDHGIPIEPNSVFDIASVSKQFGAFAIAMLVDQGVISLDDDIRKHIPEVPDFGHTITLRNLVHHTSGIRDWPVTLAIGGWQFDEVISMDQILRMVETQEDLNFRPGDEYTYSNTGYNLLAMTVERVTGQTFREWTDEHIFQPLGMNDTHFHDDHQEVVPRRVQGYFQDGDTYKMMANSLMALGSSSLYTTVEDLAKWSANFETGSVGGSDVMEMVHERGVLNNGDTIAYAFGHTIGDYKGFQRISHSGGWAGFRTFLVRFPAENLAIIVLSNNGSLNPGQKAFEIAETILSIEEEEESEKEEDSTLYVEAEIDPEVLDDYEGDFEMMPGFVLSFRRDDEKFFTQATGQPEFEMTPSSDSSFFIEQFAATVIFHRDKDGSVNRLTLLQNGERGATRVESFKASLVDLEEVEGLYYSPELKTFYEIELEEGALTGRHQRLGVSSLKLENRNLLSSNFINPIRIVRDDLGRITRLELGQGRVRNVRLERIEPWEFEKY